mmetsp:Transcript_2186/g.8436  ORF Transcript_2186/g.8436 Transcript_2186/m.8436 type:complete len:225 (+) Transcript_2186:899-1573(+)
MTQKMPMTSGKLLPIQRSPLLIQRSPILRRLLLVVSSLVGAFTAPLVVSSCARLHLTTRCGSSLLILLCGELRRPRVAGTPHSRLCPARLMCCPGCSEEDRVLLSSFAPLSRAPSLLGAPRSTTVRRCASFSGEILVVVVNTLQSERVCHDDDDSVGGTRCRWCGRGGRCASTARRGPPREGTPPPLCPQTTSSSEEDSTDAGTLTSSPDGVAFRRLRREERWW